MISIYRANDLAEAALLRHLLTEHDISSWVRYEYLQRGMGDLPVIFPEVCLFEERDLPLARQCVAEFKAQLQAEPRQDVSCRKCREDNPSNFETCWKCGVELRGVSS